MRIKRVCVLTETYYPVTGGGEVQADALARGLARKGRRTQILTRRTDPNLPASERLGPVHVCRLPPSGSGRFKKWGLGFTAFCALIRLRNTYDALVVCGFRVLGIPAVAAALLLDKPCLLKADVCGELSGEFARSGLGRFDSARSGLIFRGAFALRNRLLRRATGFVAISSVIEDELHRHGLPAERIHRIPNSVDTDRFSPASTRQKDELRSRLGIPRGARVAAYTGRLETTKGLPLLLKAWQIAIDADPNALLLLVGDGGLGIHNCEAELRDFVSASSLNQSVSFVGSVSNVQEYLRASDFFVLPSEREAFGVSVIEALACGLPVITTAVGGLRDIVTAEETAIVIPAGDLRALTDAIRRLFRDRSTHLGEAGRALVERRYSEALVVSRYSELLDGISDSRRRGERRA